MSDRERWVRRHLFLLHLGQFLHRAGEWLAGFLIVFGVAVLLTKRMVPGIWPHVLWVLVGVVPVLAVAYWLSLKNRFTRDESVALLDRSLGTGGLLMTLIEVPHEEWTARLPDLEERWRNSLPRLRPRRFASCTVLPLLFAVAMCLVPLRQIEADDPLAPKTAGQQATQRLENLLTALKEAEILDKEQQQELEDEIAKLVEETQKNPLTHEKWETVDALEQRMLTELTRADLEGAKLSEAVALLTQALSDSGLPLSESKVQELEEEILETLQKKLEQAESTGASGSNAGQLKEMLQRLTKNGSQQPRLPSDPQQRQELLNELREFLDQEQQTLSELRRQMQELTGTGTGTCQQCGQGDCPGGAQCQGDGAGTCQQCGGQMSGSQCAQCQGQRPGKGGVTRGRGDARLTWGDEASEQGVKFKEAVLPKGFLEDPKDEITEIRLTAPKVEPASEAPRAASRDADVATGQESVTRTLRPRHKKVVQQFFDRGD